MCCCANIAYGSCADAEELVHVYLYRGGIGVECQRAEEIGDVHVAQDVGDLCADGHVGVFEQLSHGHGCEQRGYARGDFVHRRGAQFLAVEDGARLDLHEFFHGEGVDGVVHAADGDLSCEQGHQDDGALFLDDVHFGVREGRKTRAAVVCGVVADVADDAVVSLRIRAVDVRVIEDVFAVHFRIFAVRGAQEDRFALAHGVDDVAFLVAGVDERVVIHRPRAVAVAFRDGGEKDVRIAAARVGDVAFGEVERVFGHTIVRKPLGGGGIISAGVTEVELHSVVGDVARVVKLISAEARGPRAHDVKSARSTRIRHVFVDGRGESTRGVRRHRHAGIGALEHADCFIVVLRRAIGDESGILHIFAVLEEPYVFAAPCCDDVAHGLVRGVGLVSPVGIPRLNELTVLRFEVKRVGHVVFAAAVVHKGVIFRVITLADGEVGIVGEQPAAGALRNFGGSVFRHLDDVGEQGVFDDAVHSFGDVVDLDIRKLFEDGVALAFTGALVVCDGDARLCRFFIIDHALRVTECFVEHVVGLAGLRLAHGCEGVHIDAQRVAQHHVGERGGDVGDSHARKPLQCGGSLSRRLGLGVAGKPCV